MRRLLECLSATAFCGLLIVGVARVLFDFDAHETPVAPLPLVVSAGALVAVLACWLHVRGARRRRDRRRQETAAIIHSVRSDSDAQRRASFKRLAAEFVANLSHELRTPMTVIIGYMQTLMRSELSWERAKPRLEAMASAADRLNWTINTLVLTAQLETKSRVASPTICDVAEALDVAFDEWSRISPGRVQMRAYVQRSILIDWALIEASMDQLIDNALKFSDGTVDVVVSHLGTGEDSMLEIAVHDSGIGWDESAYEALFADFRQGDGSSTRSYGGLGLGLGLVRRIAEACGVTIEVASAPYCGSTFRLRIPVAVMSEQMPAYA